MCFSGKGTETQTTKPNPQMMSDYLSFVNQASQVAQQPLNLYQGPMVAGFTPQQMTAFNEINNDQGIANPFLNTASQYYADANTPLATEAQQDMSPYTSSVVNATQQEFNNQNQQQSANLTGNAIAAGAYGGDRSGIAQAALAGQQQTAQAPVIAGLQNQGYQTGLQAAEAQNQEANQAGFGMGYLGNIAENTALQGASAEMQAGGQQQQLAQEELNIPYQQFEETQQYPFQTTQWLGNELEGIGGLTGSESTLTGAGPSVLSQLGGLGMAGLGAIGGSGGFGSSGWLTNLLGGLFGGGGDQIGMTAGYGVGNYLHRGGAVPGMSRDHRAFGGDPMSLHRPHFGAMRMHGPVMPHPHMRPSMRISPSMHHPSFGMTAPGMHVAGPMIGASGVPTGAASPVPGFAPGGGVGMAKGPSGVNYPVLPMPGNSGPVNINPAFDYSPPPPSSWQSVRAPTFEPTPLPPTNPGVGPWGGHIPGFQSPGYGDLSAGTQYFNPNATARIPYADGGDSDDDSQSFTPSPSMMLANFTGMGPVAGMGAEGPVVGPQYAEMVAPMQANAESEAMAGERAPALPQIAGFSSPVPQTAPLKPTQMRAPDMPFRTAQGDDQGVTQPVAGMSAPSGTQSSGPAFLDASSPWGMLTNAGLAMMSGSSPYPGVNIGHGLMEAEQMGQSQRAADQTAAEKAAELTEKLKMWDKILNGPPKPVVVGRSLVNPQDGSVIYSAPEKPNAEPTQYVTPDGHVLVFDKNTSKFTQGPLVGAKPSATANSGAGLAQNTIDQAAQRYNLTGQLPSLGMGSAGATMRQQILDRAAALADAQHQTGADLVATAAGTKAGTSALGQLTKNRAMVEAFASTANQNAQLAMSLAGKGADPTGVPILNRWVQWGRKDIGGNPDVSSFDTAITTFKNEYAKIMSGATGAQGSTDSARREADDLISRAATIPQLQSTISTMQQEMQNRRSSLLSQEAALRGQIRGGSGEQPAPTAPSAHPRGPAIGSVINGYRFKGGNPNDKTNWAPQ